MVWKVRKLAPKRHFEKLEDGTTATRYNMIKTLARLSTKRSMLNCTLQVQIQDDNQERITARRMDGIADTISSDAP